MINSKPSAHTSRMLIYQNEDQYEKDPSMKKKRILEVTVHGTIAYIEKSSKKERIKKLLKEMILETKIFGLSNLVKTNK